MECNCIVRSCLYRPRLCQKSKSQDQDCVTSPSYKTKIRLCLYKVLSSVQYGTLVQSSKIIERCLVYWHIHTRTHVNIHIERCLVCHISALQLQLWKRRQVSWKWVSALERTVCEEVGFMCRVGQNRIYTPCMTVCMVISLPKIPYIHRIYL